MNKNLDKFKDSFQTSTRNMTTFN